MKKKFSYNADDVSAFIQSTDTFIISLKNGKVVQYVPDSIADFRRWLLDNKIADTRQTLSRGELFK